MTVTIGKMAGKQNFKIRRRLLIFVLFITNDIVLCSENDNDVLTLQDNLDISEEISDRRRPVSGQEKEILLLDAFGRKKGHQHSSASQDDSIMDLLGKSKYRLHKHLY